MSMGRALGVSLLVALGVLVLAPSALGASLNASEQGGPAHSISGPIKPDNAYKLTASGTISFWCSEDNKVQGSPTVCGDGNPHAKGRGIDPLYCYDRNISRPFCPDANPPKGGYVAIGTSTEDRGQPLHRLEQLVSGAEKIQLLAQTPGDLAYVPGNTTYAVEFTNLSLPGGLYAHIPDARSSWADNSGSFDVNVQDLGPYAGAQASARFAFRGLWLRRAGNPRRPGQRVLSRISVQGKNITIRGTESPGRSVGAKPFLNISRSRLDDSKVSGFVRVLLSFRECRDRACSAFRTVVGRVDTSVSRTDDVSLVIRRAGVGGNRGSHARAVGQAEGRVRSTNIRGCRGAQSFRVERISRVDANGRPRGKPLEHRVAGKVCGQTFRISHTRLRMSAQVSYTAKVKRS